ncbi:MAG: hypothetical protein OEO82_08300 [Gammaproteobacteria bacterium]|nr:hypothetical protein [Gammaproteobacteria bacterium]
MASATRKPSAIDVAGIGKAKHQLIALIALGYLGACGGSAAPPEEALRDWVRQGESAAEERNRRVLVSMIAPAYADARGNTREDIENLFRLYFLQQQKVALLTRVDAIRVFDDTAAELVLDVGMAGTSDGMLGFSADAYRFEMELEKEGDDWLLMSARWGEIGEELR